MAMWAPTPCDPPLDELMWPDWGDGPAIEDAWAAIPGARSLDLDLECPLDLELGMVTSSSVQASTSSVDTSTTHSPIDDSVDDDSAAKESKAVDSLSRIAAKNVTCDSAAKNKDETTVPQSAQPSPSPKHTDFTHGGGDLRMKRKRNCHFCGYKRGNLGALLSCELCCNVFHSDCFMGKGISEKKAQYCTRCSNLCCCGGAHAMPGASDEMFSKKNVYTCIGKCCKVRLISAYSLKRAPVGLPPCSLSTFLMGGGRDEVCMLTLNANLSASCT